jgi:ATP-dependent Clp protease ATP-binding subunit ClpA
MVERRAESQTGSLTPDHKKSGIDPTLGYAKEVRHTIGKLLRRATRLL